MFWRLNAGAPWRDPPERSGPWKTVYDRFNRYRRRRFIDKLLERLQVRLDEKGLLAWDPFCVDGSNARASRAVAGADPNAPPASRRTTRWAVRAAAGAASSTWLLTVRKLPWPCT
jgi:transposase